ncbi:MAG TPA: dynamin family protein, partial [Pseudogracilibacillus sp.]|nr:dynamin family protein [Pseudogracilibacillus sp.]
MSVLQENQETVTKSHFSALYEWMLKEQDDENAYKIMELYEKYLNNEFVLCFSGHFSAGKSSIINELLNRDILPKSPIPTSANIVKITSGDGVAKVYFKEDDPVQYKEPYNIDRIKDYCMDRDTIRQIEINTSD